MLRSPEHFHPNLNIFQLEFWGPVGPALVHFGLLMMVVVMMMHLVARNRSAENKIIKAKVNRSILVHCAVSLLHFQLSG